MKQPAPDLVVAGKYCLDSQLAAGGMGSVWIARHLDLDLDVAIKFMDPECASAEGRIRFELEAKAAAHLQSPNVVNVLDYGIDDELPYIVMELLNGEDLEDRLQREGRISLDQALKILVPAARALRRAQEIGIIHRDIKPHNIFIERGHDDSEETVKILDFGIAKEMGPALVGEGTNTGHIVGSPNYMSPEHVRGAKDIDHRSDLWSLGVVLFQAVTGRLPFPGDVVGDVIGMILADPIPRATDIAPDLPFGIDEFFFKALSRDKALRFQSAREMAEAFAELVHSSSPPRLSFEPLPGSTRPPSHPKDAPTLPNVSAGASSEDTRALHAVLDTSAIASRRAKPRRAAMAAASLLLVATGVLIVLLRIGGQQKDAALDPGAQVVAPSAAPIPQEGAAPPSGAAQPAQQQPREDAPGSTPPVTNLRPGVFAGDRDPGLASHGSETAPTNSAGASSTPAGAHASDTPAFELDSSPSSSSAATKPISKTTGQGSPKGAAGKPKTPAGSSTTNPNWGF